MWYEGSVRQAERCSVQESLCLEYQFYWERVYKNRPSFRCHGDSGKPRQVFKQLKRLPSVAERYLWRNNSGNVYLQLQWKPTLKKQTDKTAMRRICQKSKHQYRFFLWMINEFCYRFDNFESDFLSLSFFLVLLNVPKCMSCVLTNSVQSLI